MNSCYKSSFFTGLEIGDHRQENQEQYTFKIWKTYVHCHDRGLVRQASERPRSLTWHWDIKTVPEGAVSSSVQLSFTSWMHGHQRRPYSCSTIVKFSHSQSI